MVYFCTREGRVDWTGTLAGFLTTLAFIPQVMKIWKTKKTRDLSLATWLGFAIGILLWIIYGIRLGETPIILFNAVTFVLTLSILICKLKYK